MALKTNEDLVRDLMNHSPFGALGQAFIMEAIRFYTEFQVNNKEKSLSDYDAEVEAGYQPFINMHAWVAVAEDVKKRNDEFYKGKL